MNIRFRIDGLTEREVNRIFSALTDFDFIKDVEIKKVLTAGFHNLCGEVVNLYDIVNIYDVTIHIYDKVSIHIYDNTIHIVDCDYEREAYIDIDRVNCKRLEII